MGLSMNSLSDNKTNSAVVDALITGLTDRNSTPSTEVDNSFIQNTNIGTPNLPTPKAKPHIDVTRSFKHNVGSLLNNNNLISDGNKIMNLSLNGAKVPGGCNNTSTTGNAILDTIANNPREVIGLVQNPPDLSKVFSKENIEKTLSDGEAMAKAAYQQGVKELKQGYQDLKDTAVATYEASKAIASGIINNIGDIATAELMAYADRVNKEANKCPTGPQNQDLTKHKQINNALKTAITNQAVKLADCNNGNGTDMLNCISNGLLDDVGGKKTMLPKIMKDTSPSLTINSSTLSKLSNSPNLKGMVKKTFNPFNTIKKAVNNKTKSDNTADIGTNSVKLFGTESLSNVKQISRQAKPNRHIRQKPSKHQSDFMYANALGEAIVTAAR